MISKIQRIKQTLGPGILFAATAIGVSHLIQSTKAGAEYGLTLFGFVLVANVLKYPFFEFGSRYAAATGETLIHGYKRIHSFFLYLYIQVTIISMLFVTALVGAVTAGFLETLFGFNLLFDSNYATLLILFCAGFLLLSIGNYKSLDKLIKLLGSILLATTIVAFVLTLYQGPTTSNSLFTTIDNETLLYLIPLLGWMPTAVDLSAWNSIWTIEKIAVSGYKPTVKETVREFNFGYWISATLALFFLIMGAFLVFDTPTEIPNNSVAFSKFTIDLYTQTIGDWSYYIIASAGFSIMLSTFLTVIDGYTRSFQISVELASKTKKIKQKKTGFLIAVTLGGLGLILICMQLENGFNFLLKSATAISFLIAPIIAILNLKLVNEKYIGKENVPSKFKIFLSYCGILFLTVFSIYYILA
ncbi:MAG: NRAMP family divalent metal transporter [Lishizhenia sp.]